MPKIQHTIPVKLVDLDRQKITESLVGRLELRENSIAYYLEFYANEPNNDDEAMPWENIYNNTIAFASKSAICSIWKEYNDAKSLWKISVFVQGATNDIFVYIEDAEKAELLFSLLEHWLYGE